MSQAESYATRDLAAEIAASLLDDVTDLVSPPDVCVSVFELIESNHASARAIGEVISRDPSLTARLLKLVNSAYYNFSRKIDTVSRAIAVAGVRELYSLVLAVSAIRSFSNLPNSLVNIDTFWRHGIYTGLIARALAKRCRVLHPERLFVGGLLHDIGSLVMYNRMPDVCAELLMMAEGDEAVLHQAELAELGFSHADLGGAMLKQWNLPEALQQAVAHHHTPSEASSAGLETAIVHLSDILANRSELGAFCEHPETGTSLPVDPVTWEITRLDERRFDADEVIGEAGLQFAETATLLLARA